MRARTPPHKPVLLLLTNPRCSFAPMGSLIRAIRSITAPCSSDGNGGSMSGDARQDAPLSGGAAAASPPPSWSSPPRLVLCELAWLYLTDLEEQAASMTAKLDSLSAHISRLDALVTTTMSAQARTACGCCCLRRSCVHSTIDFSCVCAPAPQNEAANRTLALFSAIFLPLSFTTGVYGMSESVGLATPGRHAQHWSCDCHCCVAADFLPGQIPELQWHRGYNFFRLLVGPASARKHAI